MLTTDLQYNFEQKKPSLRCYLCGSKNVYAVCHHCRRALCKEHANTLISQRLGFWKALFIELGWMRSPDIDPIAQGISPVRIRLLYEFLCTFRLIEIRNPEFDHYDRSGPPKQVKTQEEVIGQYWKGIKKKFAYFLGSKGDKKNQIGNPHHCLECFHYEIRVPHIIQLILLVLFASCTLAARALWMSSIYFSPLPSLLSWIGTNPTSLLIALPLTLVFMPCVFILFAITLFTNLGYSRAQKSWLGPMPLPGQVYTIQVVESCSGSISLDQNGIYQFTLSEMSGKLTLPMGFTPIDRDYYYYPYMEKARWLGINDPVPYRYICSGFLLFPSIVWKSVNSNLKFFPSSNIYPITFSPAHNPVQPLLNNQRQLEERRKFTWDYKALDPKTGRKIPIQLVVSLPANSDHRMLELELELTNPEMEQADRVIIEELEIWLPTDMGIIIRQEPEGYLTVDNTHQADLTHHWQVIKWKGLAFNSSRYIGKAYRRSIFIQFQQPFPTDNMWLKGHLRLKIPWAFSGLNMVVVCNPFGEKRSREPEFKAKTLYDIKLNLSLSCLRYQRTKTFSKEIELPGLLPDTNFITAITDRLSNGNFYIKRITENPSRTSKEGANKIHRYWDISGRKYEGIYPIDFHLVIIGEEDEVPQEQSERQAGDLKVIINAHGSVTNSIMEKRIESAGKQLVLLINQVKG